MGYTVVKRSRERRPQLPGWFTWVGRLAVATALLVGAIVLTILMVKLAGVGGVIGGWMEAATFERPFNIRVREIASQTGVWLWIVAIPAFVTLEAFTAACVARTLPLQRSLSMWSATYRNMGECYALNVEEGKSSVRASLAASSVFVRSMPNVVAVLFVRELA